MSFLLSKRVIVLLAVLVVAGATAAIALSALTSQTVIYDANSVHLRVVRSSAEGFDSGWHVHPGIAVVQVQEGSFQITQGSCTPKTVNAGDTYIEVPHLPVRAVAAGHVAWTSTLITSANDLPQIPWASYGGGAKDPCS
jgi:hypothetical protein